MNKKIVIVILIMLIAVVLIGIYIMQTKKDTSKIIYTINNNMNNYDAKYSERGFYINTFKEPDSPWFYTIAMGEQNSGGYSISIEEVTVDDNDNVVVIVKESYPSTKMVTMALTYPTCMIEFSKKPNSIIIKNIEGENFENLGFK